MHLPSVCPSYKVRRPVRSIGSCKLGLVCTWATSSLCSSDGNQKECTVRAIRYARLRAVSQAGKMSLEQ